MVDTSHGPLPTEAEIRRQIDFHARWKNNAGRVSGTVER
jgi:hypothetical protein